MLSTLIDTSDIISTKSEAKQILIGRGIILVGLGNENGSPDYSAFLAAFQEEISVLYAIGPNNEGLLEVDGVRQFVRIRWPSSEIPGFLGRFSSFKVVKYVDESDNSDWILMEIDARNSPSTALAFVATIVSELLGTKSIGQRVVSSIREWRDFLDEFQFISRSRQVGLIGELLFVLHLRGVIGETNALRAWLGPPLGEHDFSLENCEVEVKTTELERRVHGISSETQLVPAVNRSLYLLSIQVTESGGGVNSFSLDGLVAELQESFSARFDEVAERLQKAGWDDRFRELYSTRFQFRSVPLLFRVDPGFPAITREMLDSNIGNGKSVSSVRYKIDLTGIEPSNDLFKEVVGFGAISGD